jgi:hypothetical protein
VHGCSFTSVPLGAADLFIDVLHPAGCRNVIITGGIGRETPPLWDELAARGLCTLFGWDQPWVRGRPPAHVDLRSQGNKRKPVLEGFDLEMKAEELRAHCTEADVFFELFAARCTSRGLNVTFAGNPMETQSRGGMRSGHNMMAASKDDDTRVFLENASTHTGTNVEYTRSTLAAIGLGPSVDVAVVQQPQLQRRTCLTWEKQTGKRPVGWTVRPTEAATAGHSVAELLKYALGEVQRIPVYAAADKAFCVLRDDFPHELVPSLLAFEPVIRAQLEE